MTPVRGTIHSFREDRNSSCRKNWKLTWVVGKVRKSSVYSSVCPRFDFSGACCSEHLFVLPHRHPNRYKECQVTSHDQPGQRYGENGTDLSASDLFSLHVQPLVRLTFFCCMYLSYKSQGWGVSQILPGPTMAGWKVIWLSEDIAQRDGLKLECEESGGRRRHSPRWGTAGRALDLIQAALSLPCLPTCHTMTYFHTWDLEDKLAT